MSVVDFSSVTVSVFIVWPGCFLQRCPRLTCFAALGLGRLRHGVIGGFSRAGAAL